LHFAFGLKVNPLLCGYGIGGNDSPEARKMTSATIPLHLSKILLYFGNIS